MRHNGRQYTDHKNISVGKNTGEGILRFGAQLSSAMTAASDKAIYFRGGALKVWNGSSESDVLSGGSGVSTWDGMYDLDQSLTIDAGTMTFALTHATNDGVTFTGDAGSAGDVIQITNAGTGSDIKGTSGTWSVSKAGAITAISIADSGTNTTLQVDGNGSGGVDIGSTSTGAITLGAAVNVAASKLVTIAGVDGSDMLVMTAGDAVLSDGSLSITDTDNAPSLIMVNNTITTTNLITVTSTSLTTGNGFLMTANGLTEGAMVKLVTTAAGLTTGSYLLVDDGAARFKVAADGATTISTGVNSTVALTITGIQTAENAMAITTSGITASDKASLLLNPSGAIASGGNVLRVAPSGAPNAGAIAVELVGASKTCQMLYVDGDSTGVAVVGLNGGGALTDGFGVLNVTNDGNLATGGNVVNITMGGTPHTAAAALEISAAKDAFAFYVTSSAATNSAVYVTSNGAIADNKAVVEIVATGTPAATGSNILRVDGSGITATNNPIVAEFVAATKDATALYTSSANVTNSANYMTSSGAIADNKAVLEVVATGTPAAAGSNILRVDGSGITATNAPVVLEVVGAGKNVTAISSVAAATTNSAHYLEGSAALAQDKAGLEVVVSAAANHADSGAVRFAQSSATGAGYVMNLVQADVSEPLINFECTAGAGNSVDTTATTAGATIGFIRIALNGTDGYIIVSQAPTGP